MQTQVSLLSEFYQEEECSSSSTSTPPPELESQDERLRSKHWARTGLSYVEVCFQGVWTILVSMVVSFIPSFVPRWGADKKAKDGVQDRRLSPTAYLDGLRLVDT